MLVQLREWQTDSVVGTGRDGGAAGQQWTGTYGWWWIHLESHILSASSFSASAPSPQWSSVLFMKTPHHPFWGTRLSICLFLTSLQAGLGGWSLFKSSPGHLPTEHLRRAISRTTIPIFIQISHQPGTWDESQADFSLSCWMSLKRKFMGFEVSAAN